MIAYNWTFPSFDCYPDQSGLADVVAMIHWQIRAVESGSNGTIYISEAGAGTSLPAVNPEDFIPFDQLTTGEAASWVIQLENITGTNGVYERLALDIENQKNPPIVKKTLVS